ncbi:carboxypeptidase-like regulatory domain-containing protein [Pontimicrobium sp. MEBiC06410]
MMTRIFLILISCCYCFLLDAQTITLKGKVIDSSGVALTYANVIAEPKEDISLAFAISDEQGNYKLTLQKDHEYQIKITYLGYVPDSLNITATKDIIKNFILKESLETLGEVELEYTPPVTVKKDTITYRTDAFTTGEERKLRDILKKLPAVEVDRAGNVRVQGKKITKVLVENKEFFTGDSKLAVNNIPADAVDKIEVLDDYHEVGFLKGLSDSDEMAMNILLKEDKKRFVFGDIEAGLGVENRHVIHPSLYYYSPKRSVNVIGDINNTGKKSFTVKDYIDFEGGRSKLVNDAKSYFSLLNDDFAKFLSNSDFVANKNNFGALSFSQEINASTDFISYGIFSKTKSTEQQEIINNYSLNENENLLENRNTTGEQESEFGIGKLKFKIEPNINTFTSLETYIKASRNTSKGNINTFSSENNNTIQTNINADNVSIKQKVQWHKQFNKTHTTSAIFNYQYQKATPNTNWITNTSILQGLIPIIDQNIFNINKVNFSQSNTIDVAIKHYWVINNFNHLYFTLGLDNVYDRLKTNEFQVLEDESINSFSSSNFNNDTRLDFSDKYIGVHYKLKRGKVTFKPGVFFHDYRWNLQQFESELNKSKSLLLPELVTDIEFSNKKKLKLKYNLLSRFPRIFQFANRFTLANFNSIYRGNENLENQLYHRINLRYYRFNLFKDIFYSLSANYRIKEENIKNITTLNGIDFVSSPVLGNFEDKVFSFNGSFRKGIGNYKLSLNANISFSDYDNPINNQLIANSSKTYSFGGGVKTKFKEFPNIDLNYNKSISNYSSGVTSRFETDLFSAFLEYDFFDDFIFNIDYRYELYNNKTVGVSNKFNTANTSLFYQMTDSPWGFELSANNIFDVRFKQRNSFSSFLISDQKTFILPRILLFKISYKI